MIEDCGAPMNLLNISMIEYKDNPIENIKNDQVNKLPIVSFMQKRSPRLPERNAIVSQTKSKAGLRQKNIKMKPMTNGLL